MPIRREPESEANVAKNWGKLEAFGTPKYLIFYQNALAYREYSDSTNEA